MANNNPKSPLSDKEQYDKVAAEIQKSFDLGLVGSNLRKSVDDVSLRERLAILCNVLDIENTADILGIDNESLEAVLQNVILTPRQQRLLNQAYYNIWDDEDNFNYESTYIDEVTGEEVTESQVIAFSDVEELAVSLSQALDWINEVQQVGTVYQDNFIQAVAENRISLDNLDSTEDAGYLLFGEGLDSGHRSKINEFIASGNDTNEMFEAYRLDKENYGTIWFPRGDDNFDASEWWKWFRETFYA